MAGQNNDTGIGLIEVYDLDAAADSLLANISTRGRVGTDDDVMIGGFIAGNETGATRVLIRGIGPSLTGQIAEPAGRSRSGVARQQRSNAGD